MLNSILYYKNKYSILFSSRILHAVWLIDTKGEEGMKLPYTSVYLAKFKPDSVL